MVLALTRLLLALLLSACQPLSLDALQIRERLDQRPVEFIVTVIRVAF